MPKKKRPPGNAVAWCRLHERLMNDVYIRRRRCVMRRCRHLNWLDADKHEKDDGHQEAGPSK